MPRPRIVKSSLSIETHREEGKPRAKVRVISPLGIHSTHKVSRQECIDLAKKFLETAEFLRG